MNRNSVARPNETYLHAYRVETYGWFKRRNGNAQRPTKRNFRKLKARAAAKRAKASRKRNRGRA